MSNNNVHFNSGGKVLFDATGKIKMCDANCCSDCHCAAGQVATNFDLVFHNATNEAAGLNGNTYNVQRFVLGSCFGQLDNPAVNVRWINVNTYYDTLFTPQFRLQIGFNITVFGSNISYFDTYSVLGSTKQNCLASHSFNNTPNLGGSNINLNYTITGNL